MKNELTKQFVSKTFRRTFICVLVIFIVTTIMQSIEPIIVNQLALTQMQNDDTMYMIVTLYNRLKVISNIVVYGFILRFVYTVGRDTYKFVKAIHNSTDN